ncbi:MAG: serine/threonine-protein phosphatase, partial [Elusimicrobia bacterium]|nr:serine/threonine-protein phosphatase [Elusimicrobiota bacterium]
TVSPLASEPVSQLTDKPANRPTGKLNEVEVIQSGGFMLGVMENISEMLEDQTLQLNCGDKVVLYTDGVTEARNSQEELYTLERLIESVKGHGHKPAEELIAAVRQEVYGFISTQGQYDDITLVVMECG